jgi:CheY-like chemotaxis protein/DNA-binding XRE family transcriptional regulator
MCGFSINKHLGASVRKLRFRLEISQEAVAERADLHRTYIADIERGARNVTLKSIDKLATALEVSTADLLLRTCSTPRSHRTKHPSATNLPDILLVEDDPKDAELTLCAFLKAGIANQLHVARDGEEALGHILRSRDTGEGLKHDPALVILLDLNSPKACAMEVLTRVKSNSKTRKIPVIVLTTSQSGPNIQDSKRLGAVAYIVKPIDFTNFSQITPKLSLLWALMHRSLAPNEIEAQ